MASRQWHLFKNTEGLRHVLEIYVGAETDMAVLGEPYGDLSFVAWEKLTSSLEREAVVSAAGVVYAHVDSARKRWLHDMRQIGRKAMMQKAAARQPAVYGFNFEDVDWSATRLGKHGHCAYGIAMWHGRAINTKERSHRHFGTRLPEDLGGPGLCEHRCCVPDSAAHRVLRCCPPVPCKCRQGERGHPATLVLPP